MGELTLLITIYRVHEQLVIKHLLKLIIHIYFEKIIDILIRIMIILKIIIYIREKISNEKDEEKIKEEKINAIRTLEQD